jgi:small-conductance mechanosensitive channel
MDFTAEQKAEVTRLIEEATAQLVKHNSELLRDLKKNERNGKSVDPAELEKVEAENDRLTAENKELAKSVKTSAKLADDATKALQQESGFTSSLLIDQGLTSALTANGVTNPALLKGALAMLKAQGAQVVVDGDKRVARLGEKALADAVKEFAASDEGKHFVSAKQNTGGGAQGGGGTTTTNTMTRASFEALSPMAKSEFGKKGGTLTDG